MIALVTSHFNFASFKRPVDNLIRFLNQNPDCYGTELYLPFQKPVTTDYKNWIQIEANENNILFQKEALLNLTVSRLPDNINNIAIIDADIEFANKDWLNQSDEMLQDVKLLQPYSKAYWLNEIGMPYQNKESCMKDTEGLAIQFRSHPGFAWCMQRNLFDFGLYPYCYLGSGDTALSFALLNLPPLERIFPHEKSKEHYLEWAQKLNKWADGKYGFVEGNIFHHYHGSTNNRRYANRNVVTDPIDITTKLQLEDGLLTFSDIVKNKTRQAIRQYFFDRNEDEENDDSLSFDLMQIAAKKLFPNENYVVTTKKIFGSYEPTREQIVEVIRKHFMG